VLLRREPAVERVLRDEHDALLLEVMHDEVAHRGLPRGGASRDADEERFFAATASLDALVDRAREPAVDRVRVPRDAAAVRAATFPDAAVPLEELREVRVAVAVARRDRGSGRGRAGHDVATQGGRARWRHRDLVVRREVPVEHVRRRRAGHGLDDDDDDDDDATWRGAARCDEDGRRIDRSTSSCSLAVRSARPG